MYKNTEFVFESINEVLHNLILILKIIHGVEIKGSKLLFFLNRTSNEICFSFYLGISFNFICSVISFKSSRSVSGLVFVITTNQTA
jgi:hypothetical protein